MEDHFGHHHHWIIDAGGFRTYRDIGADCLFVVVCFSIL